VTSIKISVKIKKTGKNESIIPSGVRFFHKRRNQIVKLPIAGRYLVGLSPNVRKPQNNKSVSSHFSPISKQLFKYFGWILPILCVFFALFYPLSLKPFCCPVVSLEGLVFLQFSEIKFVIRAFLPQNDIPTNTFPCFYLMTETP